MQNLSGGELQRTAIVLALGKPADIYLIDEPSAYLDSEQVRPPPRTKWTRHVPHPVLIGHAASPAAALERPARLWKALECSAIAS